MSLFGTQHGLSISYRPPAGDDEPNDMAAAWLRGDMQRYEQLRGEHERRTPKFTPRPTTKPARPKGGQRRLDWERIHSMRAEGAKLETIANALGCGITQVWRVLQRPLNNQT